ncbi:MAG: HisA/HisF-related TIM barrel protein [Planctomycetota bacterium]|nr:HisA/HisF-related TIM barrel protein [Planctomycetota bacterium]
MTDEWLERVLPVMDVQHGRVVHALRGNREQYRSVQQLGLQSDELPCVAEWYATHYGFRHFYVADLDAIRTSKPSHLVGLETPKISGTFYLDAGWSIESLANCDFETRPDHEVIPVIATEALSCLEELEGLHEVAPPGSELSVDLKQGHLCSPQLKLTEPLKLVEFAYRVGFRHFLILDLADVGQQEGTSSLMLLQELRQSCLEAVFWGGGGVRDMQDLAHLWKCGYERVLIATAFYRGSITRRQLREAQVPSSDC